jgi:hypothetical protein
MKHNTLRKLAATVLASVDRDTAAQLAASIATSASRPNGSPVLRTIAAIVAKSLADSSRAPETKSTVPSRSVSEPDNRGWQRALDAMTAAPVPRGGTTEPGDDTTLLETREAPMTKSPPLKGLLTGYYDTANIGRYTFTLMNAVQLGVGYPRNPGNIGGQFWLQDMPDGAWHRLKDRGARFLDIWVRWQNHDLHVLVGHGPEKSPVLTATDLGR